MKSSTICTPENRLISSFEEINEFVDESGNEPKQSNKNIKEYQLFTRLEAIRNNPEKIRILQDYDRHQLLGEIKKTLSIHDILKNCHSEIFQNLENNIFDLTNIPKPLSSPDYIAKRTPCNDFESFKKLFKKCHSDLASGKRIIRPFSKEIKKGQFYILKGILLYVAEIEKPRLFLEEKILVFVAFLKLTESDMLQRSLSAELYKDGRLVTEHSNKLLDEFTSISNEDIEFGYIYIAKSLSESPKIKSINNLYKIGFSRSTAEDRIKNAEQEPAFLMAPVQLVASYKCYNVKPQKLENKLHAFFGGACLNLDIFDKHGKRCCPREWFVAPLDAIEYSIGLLLNGEITKFKYDLVLQAIVPKNLEINQ